FEKFFIAKQIKGSFGKLVIVKNGIYLIVEHTEAMHVIDVNSGKRIARKTDSQEDSAMEANMIAAEEIARQIRLRDMGGIISIDFIDLDKKSNQKKLFTTFSDYMRSDKSRHTILPLNQFGIMQVTRHRVRKETNIDTSEMCPACQGSGKIKPSIMIVDEIENTIDFLINKQLEKNISIVVHPFLYSYLTQNFKIYRLKWIIKYKQWIKITPNESFYLTQYQFYNKAKEEIMLWGEMPV
ncbi:MAG: ribonuclease E/G, partial [Bacteroidales bacterium]|nr:ribonuclease E/G [Bacteroidales bacterium]